MNSIQEPRVQSLFEVVELTEGELKQTEGGWIGIAIGCTLVVCYFSSALGSLSTAIW